MLNPALLTLAAVIVPPGGAITLEQVLASAPPELVTQIQPHTLEAVREGEIPLEEFARSLGISVFPQAAPTELQEKQFITHWLYHYYALSAGIDEDPVGEATISGRCSSLPITDVPQAPTMGAELWRDKMIYTTYYQAPFNSSTCTYDNTDLTRYFVTWVKSPSAQAVRAWVGASDYFKLWINGTLVGQRNSGGGKPYTVDEYKYPANLRAGWNLIVFKHSFPQLGPSTDPDDNKRYKYFSLRFVRDDAGTPVTNLVATFDPDPSCDDRAPYSTATQTRVLFPSVAHLPGRAGSQWRTDIELYNGFHMAWEYRFRYFREGNNSGAPDATRTTVLQPFEGKVFRDALRSSEFFNVPSDQKGYAWMSGAYYYYTIFYGQARAKVYNQASTGTFGMETSLLHPYSFSYRGYFFNLRNGAYRTNLAVIPSKNEGSSYRVRMILSSPEFGTLTKEWPANPSERLTGFAQLNDVFGYFGVGSTSTDRALLYVVFLDTSFSDLYFFPSVTVNDNGTSDPEFRLSGNPISDPPIF